MSVFLFSRMPTVFSRKKKEDKVSRSVSAGGDSVVKEKSQGSGYVDKKIYTDLKSLEADISATARSSKPYSEQHESNTVEGDPGLRPRGRRTLDRRSLQRPTHIYTSSGTQSTFQEIASTFEQELDRARLQHLPSSQSLPHLPLEMGPSSTASPGVGANLVTSTPKSQRLWGVFGRGRSNSYGPSSMKPDVLSSNGDSMSQISRTPTWFTAPSYHSLSGPTTPRSHSRSFDLASPQSRSSLFYSDNQRSGLLPSPHTFGVPTPPQSRTDALQDRRSQSYFGFKDPPPPLPPLDHPAFLAAQRRDRRPGGSSSLRNHKVPRHAHSLSSLKRVRESDISNAGQTKATVRERKMSRSRSRSGKLEEGGTCSIDERASGSQVGNRQHQHARTASKSSVTSNLTRRSSAEFSARQASSIANEGAAEDCWEVQVTKEMIRLALGEVPGMEHNARQRIGEGAPSLSRKARGKNWLSGEAGLGSPFLLQDHSITSTNSALDDLTEPGNYLVQNIQSSRDEVMSNGNVKNQIPVTTISRPSSRKGKERAVDESPTPGSSSRKGGARALSHPSRTRTPSPTPRIDTVPFFTSIQATSSLLGAPTLAVTAPTPEASPISPKRVHHKSTPTRPSALRVPLSPPIVEKSYSSGSTKRKAEDAEVTGDKTPPKEGHRTSFAPEPRTHRVSTASSHAPSSFNRSKRVRLTESSEGRTWSSRTASGSDGLPMLESSPPRMKSTGSWSSRGSRGSHRPLSQGYFIPPPTRSTSSHSHRPAPIQTHRAPSRRSLSQASIPVSALVSPHAPSIGRSSQFHMRDPRKPPPIQPTPWTLSLPSQVERDESRWERTSWIERGGSPPHAWLFFLGFVIFPVWWCAAVLVPIPQTRRLGGEDAEKGVLLDDPQVEHDAKSWRLRCRVMSIISFFTYIPFIVLVAIFA